MSAGFSNRLLERLGRAGRVVAFTGAGVSAESGVPTFRGNDGLWARFKPEELANINAFMKNPELVWEWYAARKRVIASIQPNAGHRTLARMESMFTHVAVVTQNIDNLHARAEDTTVYELHGNIERNYCMKCGTPYANAPVLAMQGVPRCTRHGCGGVIRPDVVWFGEQLPEEPWTASVRAIASADVFLSIGTSGVVYPAASLPSLARQNGVFVLEINPEPTPITEIADEFIAGPSGAVLPELYERLKLIRSEQHTST